MTAAAGMRTPTGRAVPWARCSPFLIEQTRIVLRFLARLAAQAAAMLRRATDRLRARRAPEGIDEAPAPEEISAPEDVEDEYDEVDEGRAPARV